MPYNETGLLLEAFPRAIPLLSGLGISLSSMAQEFIQGINQLRDKINDKFRFI
ncbi:MAG: hypothetical protein WCR02_11915 [Sphaerochaetaceae bacterium]